MSPCATAAVVCNGILSVTVVPRPGALSVFELERQVKIRVQYFDKIVYTNDIDVKVLELGNDTGASTIRTYKLQGNAPAISDGRVDTAASQAFIESFLD